MNEVLQKLLSSEMLTEAARTEISEAFTTAFNEAVEGAVKEKEEALVVEYAAQFAADREQLIEAIDTKVEEMLREQLEELREDVAAFRDLEAEYTVKLAEQVADHQASLAEAVENDLKTLVENLDNFLEERLAHEVDGLRESIEDVRKNNLGRQIFEAFIAEAQTFVDAEKGVNALQAQLAEATAALAARDAALSEAQKTIATSARKVEMENVLASLQGRPREVMEAILASVPTDKLEESYNKFIGRVLHESTENSEKERSAASVVTPVLAESVDGGVVEAVVESTVIVTGDEVVNESQSAPVISEAARNAMRLAGITV